MNKEAISIRNLMHRVYPIHRSQTGEGVRRTFDVLREFGVPLEIVEVPTGEKAFDWFVPKEWKINDAYIKDANGRRIVDYRDSNLHILNGSVPIRQQMQFAELEPFLHLHPTLEDAIPYRTAFFEDKWGFCVSKNQYERLQKCDGASLDVCIDSEIFEGHLSYGEAVIPGRSEQTVVIWTHTCHPSLANDNVSGIVASAHLYNRLQCEDRKFTYRFVFAPATIGAITWLAKNQTDNVVFGLVLCLLGDDQNFTLKKTRLENHLIDRCIESIGRERADSISIIPFSPIGYDERQFCSPGVNLPFARISRSEPGEFPEYHSSKDSLSFISEFRILESVDMIYSLLENAENNCLPINISPECEPRLGHLGLFARFGDREDIAAANQEAVLWTLNLADGHHDALAISKRSTLPFSKIVRAINVLAKHGLLKVDEVV